MGIMKEKSMYRFSSDVGTAFARHISRLAARGPLARAASQQILLTNHLKIDGVPLFDIVLSQLLQ